MARRSPYSWPWPLIRAQVLERDNWECKIVGPNCEHTATEVDHIIPLEDGGARLDPHNLRAACRPCNRGRKRRRARLDLPAPAGPSREW